MTGGGVTVTTDVVAGSVVPNRELPNGSIPDQLEGTGEEPVRCLAPMGSLTLTVRRLDVCPLPSSFTRSRPVLLQLAATQRLHSSKDLSSLGDAD